MTAKLQQIGRYVVRSRLGEGTFGVVYRAWDPQFEFEVAIKLCKPLEDGTQSQESIARFKREARVAAQLQHPNIVPVRDMGAITVRGQKQPYFVMPFLPGSTLAGEIKSGRQFADEEIVRTIRGMALGLHHAHAAGLVHRDIKPANVMLDENGHPQVADFGVAFIEQASQALSQTGQMLGTPLYMSPEQVKYIPGEIDGRADIYSTGVVMYELLCGEVPYQGPAMSVLFNIVQNTPYPKPSEIRQGVNPVLEAICLQAMAHDKSQRFATAEELATAFDQTAAGTLPAKPNPPRTAAGPVSLPTPPSPRARSAVPPPPPPTIGNAGANATFLVPPIVVASEPNRSRRPRTSPGRDLAGSSSPWWKLFVVGGILAGLYGGLILATRSTVTVDDSVPGTVPDAVKRHTTPPQDTRPAVPEDTPKQPVAPPPNVPMVNVPIQNLTANNQPKAPPDNTPPVPPVVVDPFADFTGPYPNAVLNRTMKTRCFGNFVMSRQGKFIAFYDTEKNLQLWLTRTGQKINVWQSHGYSFYDLVFSPCERFLVTLGRISKDGAGQRRVWSTKTCEHVCEFNAEYSHNIHLCFDPTGEFMAVCGDDIQGLENGSVAVYSTQTFQPQFVLTDGPSDQAFDKTSFSPDGKMIVCTRHPDCLLWNFAKQSLSNKWTPHGKEGTQILCWSDDSTVLATGGRDGKVRRWLAVDGQLLSTWSDHSTFVGTLDFGRSGAELVSSANKVADAFDDNTVLIYGQNKHLISPGNLNTPDPKFTPDGQFVVTHKIGNPEIAFWSTRTGKPHQRLGKQNKEADRLMFSADGKILARLVSGKIEIYSINAFDK